ncbi:hypothetical protein NYE40_10935 [Paenibacillus sp. FSL W8-1187]|uniref:Zinc-finger domain-containing protein n=1 Tax=Paenibacillus pasadenensis TaxID=217090 RepID=A0A2N5N5P2_9BACL|nr:MULTISPECIES: hypothetical protein [Paenibacillus]PLT45667.1 hypothetical protein B8V81_4098 [Paenibacillus pasadenensis]QGG56112.1 hypothetical protein GE073_11355 [Paenibacillus sp. B01]
MKCEEVQDALALYWDLPDGEPLKQSVDLHLKHCIACRQEYELWAESERLIQELSDMEEHEMSERAEEVNRTVMDRIYAEDHMDWTLKRRFSLSRSFGPRLSAAVAACLAMFCTSLLYVLLGRGQSDETKGIMDTANASSSPVFKASISGDIPVATVSDPLLLSLVPRTPQYWIILSMLGLVMTMLMMGWLSRNRK